MSWGSIDAKLMEEWNTWKISKEDAEILVVYCFPWSEEGETLAE